MKLNKCYLDESIIVGRPPKKTSPDTEWIQSHKDNRIPPSIYKFYCNAEYFSIDKIPTFLSLENGKLYFYLSSILNGIRTSIDESYDLLYDIKKYHKNSWDPIKEVEGNNFDPDAGNLKIRSFKYLLVNLSCSLDLFAETVALFFPGMISQLQVGKASFSDLANWSKQKIPFNSKICSEELYFLKKLHEEVSKKIVGIGSEQDWFELFMLYRNKFTHLGDFIFPKYEFHDSTLHFFIFIPKLFPISIEEYIKIDTRKNQHGHGSIKKFALDNLIHQDLIEYSNLLIERIKNLLDIGFEIISQYYNNFCDSDPKQESLKLLKKNSKKYSFCNFI